MEGTASLWMDGKIFRVGKRARGSTALKQCLTKDLILFSNLREILPIQGNLRYTGHFKVLRSSGLMKEISTNSVSIRKLNG